ncbi:MAG: HAMP domain-containing histidine kinase [Myxococcota bacterium]|nr:HAMP domain-containing histidine kinase [Myxococcota bacterium]
MTAPLLLQTPIAEGLRRKIQRGVDLTALVGSSIATVVQVLELTHGGSLQLLLRSAITLALAACAVLGLLMRARWTPIAYLAIVMVANVVYLTSSGPWFGMGAVYVLALALAFVFVPRPRWWWVIAILAGTPFVLGILVATGSLALAPMLLVDDGYSWRRASLAASTAVVGIAVIIRYAVEQLMRARREIESALVLELQQRREHARVEDELARARRADLIAQLAAEVGAEVGAALAIVHARAQTLARELEGTAARECLGDITEASLNAGSTMRSLTAFAPGASLGPATGDATEAVRALPKLVRRMIPPRIALTTSADDDAWVAIPTTDLARICANLVLNARDAIAGAGHITVRATREPVHVVIAVEDDGAGMDAATLARLFQPFFTTKPVGRGTGLGLATSKILVERAAGVITVVSALGRGTCFTIRLPLVARPA